MFLPIAAYGILLFGVNAKGWFTKDKENTSGKGRVK